MTLGFSMVRHYQQQFRGLNLNLKLFLVGHALHGLGYSIYSLLFNLFLREQGIGESTIGYLAATTSMGTALIAFPAAFVLERFHVKPLINIGLTIAASFYLIQIHSSSVTMFTVCGLIASMGLAVFNISLSPFIFRNAEPQGRMMLYTMNSLVVMLSHFVGFLVGGNFPKWTKGFLPSLTLIESYRVSMSLGLGLIFLAVMVFLQLTKRKIPAVKRSIFEGIRQKNWNILGRLILPKVSIALGAGLIIPFMNIYLKERLKFSTADVGWSYACLQLFILFGIFLTPKFIKRMPSIHFIVLTATLAIPFMLTMAFSSNLALVLGSFFMRGMLMNMSAPITSLFEMERVREQECLFASALLAFSYNVAWTLSTQVGGFLIEMYSFKATFIVAAFFYIVAISFYFFLFRKDKKADEPAQEKIDKIAA
jgi:predicted MFS family arabinose efflux permease